MIGPLLSTMWARQPRFEGDFSGFAAVAAEAGFVGIEVSHSATMPEIESLRSAALPVVGIHAPAPWTRTRSGEGNTRLNLAAAEESERVEALVHTIRSMELASGLEGSFVVVHLGHLTRRLEAEDRLRALWAEGRIEDEEGRAAVAEARERRASLAGPHLEAATRSLAELAERGRELGVAIGLENRLHAHEIPTPDEAAELLAPYPATRVGYWYDTGHGEVQARLGLLDRDRPLTLLGARTVGAHLHDVEGLRDHRAPGNGDLVWSVVAEGMPSTAIRTLEVDPGEPEPALAKALEFLEGQGILGRPT